MATYYKFMTAQYLLCSLFPLGSNEQISLISPGGSDIFWICFDYIQFV